MDGWRLDLEKNGWSERGERESVPETKIERGGLVKGILVF
jgi:hypothetical protein